MQLKTPHKLFPFLDYILDSSFYVNQLRYSYCYFAGWTISSPRERSIYLFDVALVCSIGYRPHNQMAVLPVYLPSIFEHLAPWWIQRRQIRVRHLHWNGNQHIRVLIILRWDCLHIWAKKWKLRAKTKWTVCFISICGTIHLWYCTRFL